MKTSLLSVVLSLLAVPTVFAAPDASPALKPTWTALPGQPTYYINSVAISGDGARTVAGTFFHSYSVRGRDRDTMAANDMTGTFGTYFYDQKGTLVWKDEFNGWQGVYWVDISTDGRWAASGGWFSKTPIAGFVRAYDITGKKTVLNYPTTARVNQVALSSDGTWLVSAANTLVLFQRVNGSYRKVDEFKSPTGSDTMETIALSADGRMLAVGDYAGYVMLFSLANGKFGTPKTWKIPGGGYSHSVRMTADGKAFAAGGSSGNFYLFDSAQFATTGLPTVTYNVPNAGSIYGVAIAADASAFVGIANVSGGKGCVYYVQRSGSTPTLKWSYATAHNPNSAALNSGVNLLAVADGHPDGTPGAFYLLNATTGALIGQFTTGNMSWPIAIAAKGNAVAAGSDDAHVYYFGGSQVAAGSASAVSQH